MFAAAAVQADDLHHLPLDPLGGVEGGHGLLEDHAHLAAAEGQHVLLRGGHDIAAQQGHRARVTLKRPSISRRMAVMEVTDLPEPDSPTTPTTSPRSI